MCQYRIKGLHVGVYVPSQLLKTWSFVKMTPVLVSGSYYPIFVAGILLCNMVVDACPVGIFLRANSTCDQIIQRSSYPAYSCSELEKEFNLDCSGCKSCALQCAFSCASKPFYQCDPSELRRCSASEAFALSLQNRDLTGTLPQWLPNLANFSSM